MYLVEVVLCATSHASPSGKQRQYLSSDGEMGDAAFITSPIFVWFKMIKFYLWTMGGKHIFFLHDASQSDFDLKK